MRSDYYKGLLTLTINAEKKGEEEKVETMIKYLENEIGGYECDTVEDEGTKEAVYIVHNTSGFLIREMKDDYKSAKEMLKASKVKKDVKEMMNDVVIEETVETVETVEEVKKMVGYMEEKRVGTTPLEELSEVVETESELRLGIYTFNKDLEFECRGFDLKISKGDNVVVTKVDKHFNIVDLDFGGNMKSFCSLDYALHNFVKKNTKQV